jgi:hypothetical protein
MRQLTCSRLVDELAVMLFILMAFPTKFRLWGSQSHPADHQLLALGRQPKPAMCEASRL